ncbi:MAG TPA: Sec-independent protein translocase TatB [Dermatophilaceae bacterium]|nr:Sec-independent protein translocase TatB [Dermatophilaceae bacterium]
MFFGINGWELVLLGLLAVFILGPERLPGYAAKLAHGIRKARVMAEGAKGQLKDQLGPEYQDVDWRQYDPRQYDPRRIVREALLEPLEDAAAPLGGSAATGVAAGAAAGGAAARRDADDGESPDAWEDRPTPYDVDAT